MENIILKYFSVLSVLLLSPMQQRNSTDSNVKPIENQRSNTLETDTSFFENFPDCFASYLQVYRNMTLHENYNNEQFLQYLDQLTRFQGIVPDSIYYRKLINLSLRANTVEELGQMLQQIIHKVAMTSSGIEGFVSCKLNSEAEHLLFWQFYFCTHKIDKKLEKNYCEIIEFAKKKSPEQQRIIDLAYHMFYSNSNLIVSSKLHSIASEGYCIDFQKALLDMEKNNSKSNQNQYFELFPDTWNTFFLILDSSQREFPIKFEYTRYLAQFERRRLDSIPIDKYFDRLIQLSFGGIWEADAVGVLQSQIIDILKNDDRRYLLSSLSQKPTNHQFLFWQFVFSCPCKDSLRLQEYDKIIQIATQVKELNQEVIYLAFELFFGNAPATCMCNNKFIPN